MIFPLLGLQIGVRQQLFREQRMGQVELGIVIHYQQVYEEFNNFKSSIIIEHYSYQPTLISTFLIQSWRINFNNIIICTMNLNPFSHNYLNQLPTSKGIKSTPQRSHTPTAKRENKQTQITIIQQQNRYKPSSPNSMEEQFLLQPRYMRCNLQFTKEGYLLAFLRKDNIISGRSYIFFPQGIIANCNVMNSKLSGWIVICKKGEFYNISHYSTGKLNGVQYIYDLRCGLTIESVYHSGKLESVKRGVADSQASFEKSIKNKELVNLLHATLNYQFLERYLPMVQSSLGNYYGAKSKEMPNGLGILITDSQCFYGNFKRGLLSGEGVMIFNNGNSYIGQFQQGMMKGYGQLIKNGTIQFKYNNTLIEQSQFNVQRNISYFYQNEEVASIFHPIINLYQKLKVIYQNRRKDPQQKSQSFVDVEMDNNVNEEQQDQIQKQSEESSTPRHNIIEELINTTNSKETEYKNTKKSPFTLILTPISQFKKEQKKQQARQKDKKEQQHPIKKKKEKAILRDQQWQQIIEELGDESVNKQDDFLKPKKENSRQQGSQINKKSGIYSKWDRHNYIGITDNRTDNMDRLQNQLIGKIITKK